MEMMADFMVGERLEACVGRRRRLRWGEMEV
jgi:hypothetical protein